MIKNIKIKYFLKGTQKDFDFSFRVSPNNLRRIDSYKISDTLIIAQFNLHHNSYPHLPILKNGSLQQPFFFT